MKPPPRSILRVVVFNGILLSVAIADSWKIDDQEEWSANLAVSEGLVLQDGVASPEKKSATLQTKVKQFDDKRSAASLVVAQSPIWQNWEPTANIGPANLRDAPVMLSLGPGNYWIFGRYGDSKAKKGKQQEQVAVVAEPVTLEGFDVPLVTTNYPNQFKAPGGLKKDLGGYHAWQSKDMVNWVHHGPVSKTKSRWMTTAEFVDGKAYFYYDFPNDQDPHLIIDEDLTDGEIGTDMGMAFKDPSHGSDSAIIRDLDGKFHLILEDWSPIEASTRSWDSPLAAHAVSEDGIKEFKLLAPPVDYRTKPTGKMASYNHPHWKKEDPKNYKTSVARYEIHEPKQEAYGDWASIAIGGQYYLFGDYDPADAHTMSVGWFTSSNINEPFAWCDHIGEGHPDPDVMFAEGRFYLATQQKLDFISPGPWVETVEVRVGVDTDADGAIDQWTGWQEVKESYDDTPGFAKQVAMTPAALDLSGLPEGYGFQIELNVTDSTENKSKPMIESLELSFAE